MNPMNVHSNSTHINIGIVHSAKREMTSIDIELGEFKLAKSHFGTSSHSSEGYKPHLIALYVQLTLIGVFSLDLKQA